MRKAALLCGLSALLGGLTAFGLAVLPLRMPRRRRRRHPPGHPKARPLQASLPCPLAVQRNSI